MRFHQKFGYKEVAYFPQIGYKFEQWHDVLWMQKELQQFVGDVPKFIPLPIDTIIIALDCLFAKCFILKLIKRCYEKMVSAVCCKIFQGACLRVARLLAGLSRESIQKRFVIFIQTH